MLLLSDLNGQQRELIDDATKWYDTQRKQTYEISGPAGSGKTTIVEFIIKATGLEPDEVAYMAYVGKAAMVLTLAGNNAKTIHSSIYYPVDKPKLDDNGKPIVINGRPVTYKGFAKKPMLDPKIKLMVIDEAPMVNTEIRNDLESFGIPIIALGDLNQLPPVIGKPAFLIKPDYILTEIMRQNKDNPIIKLSQMAINGITIPVGNYGNKCMVIPFNKVNDKLMTYVDTIICGRNSTRQRINDYYRKNILGIKDLKTINLGEKIICRQNNWGMKIDDKIHLTNGLVGTVDNIDLETFNKRSINIDFRPEFHTNEIFTDITIDYNYLFTPLDFASKGRFSFYNKFQFAYAITAHLSQGSQYDKVMVFEEKLGDYEYRKKWLYTCITRAIDKLCMVKGIPYEGDIFNEVA